MNDSTDLMTSEKVNSKTIGIHLWLTFLMCFLANVCSGLISTLMSVYLPSVVKSLAVENTNLAEISGYINGLYLLGWAIGGLAWGRISDIIGRSRSFVLSMVMLGAFTLLVSVAGSWFLVVTFRFFSGFAVGGILVLTPTLLSEAWPEKTRSIVLGIDSIGFPVGIFSSGAINNLLVDWRQGFLVGVLPATLAILSLWLVKESDAWKNASRKAGQRVHYTDNDRANLLTGAVIFSSMLIGLWGMFSWIPTWVQSLLAETDGQSQRGMAMMLLGAGGLTGGFVSGWVSNSIGVRKAMMFCFAGCLVVSFLLFAVNKSFSNIIYVELAVLSIFFGISQGLLTIYVPQLFPYLIRGTATGFCFNIGRFVTAAAVFFVAVLVNFLGGYSNTLLCFASIFAAGFIVVYNTKDQPKRF